MRERRQTSSSVVFGLLFLAGSVAGVWTGLGHHIPWNDLRVAVPCFLIGLGILGLILDRHERRHSTPKRRNS